MLLMLTSSSESAPLENHFVHVASPLTCIDDYQVGSCHAIGDSLYHFWVHIVYCRNVSLCYRYQSLPPYRSENQNPLWNISALDMLRKLVEECSSKDTSRGQGWKQCICELVSKAGNCRARIRNWSPTGLKHITKCRLVRT